MKFQLYRLMRILKIGHGNMVLEYFGNDEAVNRTNYFLQHFGMPNEKRAILYSGAPGVGKTHLTNYIAEQRRADLIVVNASNERTKDKVNDILQAVKSNSKRLFLVLDECETMKSIYIDKIIKATKIPVFLCCNYIELLEQEILDQCAVVDVRTPTWWTFEKYMKWVCEREKIPIPKDLEVRARRAKSFRHAERLIDDPDDMPTPSIESPKSQVEKILSGISLENISLPPKDLINWIYDNTNEHNMASIADMMLKRQTYTDYHVWAYIYSLLKGVRSNNKVEYPRSFKLMGKIKHEVKEQKKTEREATMTNVAVDFSKVETVEVQKGESLFEGLDQINLDELV